MTFLSVFSLSEIVVARLLTNKAKTQPRWCILCMGNLTATVSKSASAERQILIALDGASLAVFPLFPFSFAKPSLGWEGRLISKLLARKGMSVFSKMLQLYPPCKNVHAGVGTAAFVVAAVELPFAVENRFKVLALHTRYQAIASAC